MSESLEARAEHLRRETNTLLDLSFEIEEEGDVYVLRRMGDKLASTQSRYELVTLVACAHVADLLTKRGPGVVTHDGKQYHLDVEFRDRKVSTEFESTTALVEYIDTLREPVMPTDTPVSDPAVPPVPGVQPAPEPTTAPPEATGGSTPGGEGRKPKRRTLEEVEAETEARWRAKVEALEAAHRAHEREAECRILEAETELARLVRCAREFEVHVTVKEFDDVIRERFGPPAIPGRTWAVSMSGTTPSGDMVFLFASVPGGF